MAKGKKSIFDTGKDELKAIANDIHKQAFTSPKPQKVVAPPPPPIVKNKGGRPPATHGRIRTHIMIHPTMLKKLKHEAIDLNCSLSDIIDKAFLEYFENKV